MSKSDKAPLENPIFYLDECLGGEKVAQILVRGTPDRDWLPTVGQNGWILLTQDKGIKRRPLEILVLRQYQVCAFVVSAKSLRGDEIGMLILKAMPKILRVLKRYRPPIVATISRGPTVTVHEGTPRYSG